MCSNLIFLFIRKQLQVIMATGNALAGLLLALPKGGSTHKRCAKVEDVRCSFTLFQLFSSKVSTTCPEHACFEVCIALGLFRVACRVAKI